MIYLDSDGLLASWCGYVFNKHLPHLTRSEFNSMCPIRRKGLLSEIYRREPNLFANLPPIEGAREFLEWLSTTGEPFAILTSAASDHHDFDIVKESKLFFFDKHFGLPPDKIIVVETSSDKAQYAEGGAMLVDDYGRNCHEWLLAGGCTIQVATDKPDFKQLKDALTLYLEDQLSLDDNVIYV